MNIQYQTNAHASIMLERWPNLNKRQVRESVKAAILSGDAWLVREPAQMELF